MCERCSQRPEEDVRPHVTRVTDGCELPSVGTGAPNLAELGTVEEQRVVLTTEPFP